MPRKPRRRRRLGATDGSCTRRGAARPHPVWSDACVRERTHDGRPLRVRTRVDAHTRACRSIAGARRLRSDDVLGAPHGALRAARPAQLPALGHRPRVHGDSDAVLAPPAGRHDTLHRTRQSLGERRRGSMQRHAPRRGPHPRDLHDPHRSPGPQRPLAARVHPGAPAQRPRLPAARPGRAGDRTAPPHALGSPEGSRTHLASGTTIGGRSSPRSAMSTTLTLIRNWSGPVRLSTPRSKSPRSCSTFTSASSRGRSLKRSENETEAAKHSSYRSSQRRRRTPAPRGHRVLPARGWLVEPADRRGLAAGHELHPGEGGDGGPGRRSHSNQRKRHPPLGECSPIEHLYR